MFVKKHIQKHSRRSAKRIAIIGIAFTSLAALGVTTKPVSAVTFSCPSYDAPKTGNAIDSSNIKELSGLAASHRNPDVVWTHNDSGDKARVFALNTSGKMLATQNLNNVKARDFEDIDVGPGKGGEPSVYVFDTGGKQETAHVYRFPEPAISASRSQATANVNVEQFDVKYQKPGTTNQFEPINVEATFVDPSDGSLYFIHKTMNQKKTWVYKIAGLDVKTGVTLVAKPVVEITGKTNGINQGPTAADFSADRSYIVIRNYIETFVWPVGPKADVVATLTKFPQAPCTVQGSRSSEAVTVLPNGDLLTVNEGSSATFERSVMVSSKLNSVEPTSPNLTDNVKSLTNSKFRVINGRLYLQIQRP